MYYAGHAVNFEGSQWIVPASASLRERVPVSFALQCVQLNWIRFRLAEQPPRVTIYIFDCCDVVVKIDDSIVRHADWRGKIKNHIVGMKKLNSSQAALNVFIFRGAAHQTEAMESSGGGHFTKSFIKYMQVEGRTLDELSQLIRSDLGKKQPTLTRNLAVGESDVELASIVQVSPTENSLQYEFPDGTLSSDRQCVADLCQAVWKTF